MSYLLLNKIPSSNNKSYTFKFLSTTITGYIKKVSLNGEWVNSITKSFTHYLSYINKASYLLIFSNSPTAI